MTEKELHNEYRKSDCKTFTDFLINKITELEKRLVFARAEFQRQYKENAKLKEKTEVVSCYSDCKERQIKLEQENHLLGERCNQLLKDKGDLTDKIADIKANCDLAIEGRDIKIMELEKENAEQRSECRTCVFTYSPCMPSDYKKDENDLCNNYESVFDKLQELEKELAEYKKKVKCKQKHFVTSQTVNNGLVYKSVVCNTVYDCESCAMYKE